MLQLARELGLVQMSALSPELFLSWALPSELLRSALLPRFSLMSLPQAVLLSVSEYPSEVQATESARQMLSAHFFF